VPNHPGEGAVFDGVWLDHDRIVAVQPKPSFTAFFQQRRRQPSTQKARAPTQKAGVKYGSDGDQARTLPPDEIEVWLTAPPITRS
jgi:hypothetical protein